MTGSARIRETSDVRSVPDAVSPAADSHHHIGRPQDVEIIFPTVTVQAAGYADAEVDCGC